MQITSFFGHIMFQNV